MATILAMMMFGAGYAIASVVVTNATETASGTYVNGASITGWSLSTTPSATAVVTCPPGLAAASTTLATPTQLGGSGATYSVGTVTAGDICQLVRFAETVAAPSTTEIELTFTLSAASVVSTTTYIETQASPVAETDSFYLDAGSAASSSVTINYVLEISQQCSTLDTTCP